MGTVGAALAGETGLAQGQPETSSIFSGCTASDRAKLPLTGGCCLHMQEGVAACCPGGSGRPKLACSPRVAVRRLALKQPAAVCPSQAQKRPQLGAAWLAALSSTRPSKMHHAPGGYPTAVPQRGVVRSVLGCLRWAPGRRGEGQAGLQSASEPWRVAVAPCKRRQV